MTSFREQKLEDALRQVLDNRVPPMPEGFTDHTAWDAIHWRFSVDGSVLDEAVIGWQRDNQERVKAAAEAKNEWLANIALTGRAVT